MALTYTFAGLQTVGDLIDASITSHDWAEAYEQLARASIVLACLPAAAASEAQTFSMKASLDDAERRIRAAQLESERAANAGKRFVRAGVRTLTGMVGRRVR